MAGPGSGKCWFWWLARDLNGKTALLVILTLYWLYVERVELVLGTSTKLQYARESWKKAVALVRSNPVLAAEVPRNGVRSANGEEELEAGGGRYLIAASNAEGGRSLTVDRLVMDELRQHSNWDAYNAAEPATSAVRDAQIWMISNMGDSRAVVLNALRDQALSGLDSRLGLFEWSAAENAAATDVEALAMANPNLGRRIAVDNLLGSARRAAEAGGEQLAGFLTEYHCRYVPLLNPAIDLEAWAECRSAGGLDGFKDKLALCVDVSIDELHATLYAAAVDGERVRVDVVKAWEGQQAVREMCAELPSLVERIKPKVLGWFPHGPAAAATASLRARQGWPPAGVELEALSSATAVCMGFAALVRGKELAHSGDPLLDEHVRAAEKLAHGDGWRFTRKGAEHVDAVYAAAGAAHLAQMVQTTSAISLYIPGDSPE